MSTLGIHELELNSICSNPSILIITKRGGGKTWLCRTLLNHYRDIPVGIIISHTEKTDRFFQDFFPDSFIYNDYNPLIFKKILRRQIDIKKKAEIKAKQGIKIDTRIFLLIDDCLSDSKDWNKDKTLSEILYNGRHYDITYILTMQQPMGIHPGLRSNFDYIFLMTVDIYSEQKKLYEHYTGMFKTFQEFKSAYDQLTNDFGSMVVKKRNAGKEIPDKIFYFKASKINPAMIGCKQLLKFHKYNYDINWRDRMNEALFGDDLLSSRRKNYRPIEKIDSRGKVID